MDVYSPENFNQNKLKGLFNLIKKNIFFILPVAVVLIVFFAVVYLNSTGTFSPFKALQTKDKTTESKKSASNVQISPTELKIAQAKKDINSLANQLLSLNSEYKKTSNSTQKQSLLSKMQDISKKRKEALFKLLDERPASISFIALDQNTINQFPESIKPNLEEHVSLSGSLTTAIVEMKVDNEDELRTLNYLKAANQDSVLLRFAEQPKEKLAAKIKVDGIKIGNQIAVGATSNDTKVLGVTDYNSAQKPSNISAGELKVMVIPYNGVAPSAVTNVINAAGQGSGISGTGLNRDVSNYYKESSYNKITSIKPDVKPALNQTLEAEYIEGTAVCNFEDLLAQLDHSMYILGDNKIVIHVIPEDNECFEETFVKGVTFLNNDPNKRPIEIVIAKADFYTIAHELGHAMGAPHSSAISNCKNKDGKTVDIGFNCTYRDRLSYSDIMGVTSGSDTALQLNVYNRFQMGFLDDSNIEKFNGNGDYEIDPLEGAKTGKKTLKIPRRNPLNVNGKIVNVSYYLEFRQPSGVFRIGNESVFIRLVPEGEGSNWLDNQSYFVKELIEGDSFEDIDDKIEVTLKGINTRSGGSRYALVQINYEDSPGCSFIKPNLSIEDITEGVSGVVQAVNGDAKATYTINLQNYSTCLTTTGGDNFTISYTAPVGIIAEPEGNILKNVTLDSKEQLSEEDRPTLTVNLDPDLVSQLTDTPRIFAIGISAVNINYSGSPEFQAFQTVYLKVYKEGQQISTDFPGNIALAPESGGGPKPANYENTENVCIYPKENKCFVGRYINGSCSAPIGTAEGKEISCGTNTNTCVYSQNGPEITDPNDPNYNFRKGCFVGRCITDPSNPDYDANCTQGSFNVGCAYADGLGQEVACPVYACPVPYSLIEVYANDKSDKTVSDKRQVCSQYGKAQTASFPLRHTLDLKPLLDQNRIKEGEDYKFCVDFYEGVNVSKQDCTDEFYKYSPTP